MVTTSRVDAAARRRPKMTPNILVTPTGLSYNTLGEIKLDDIIDDLN